MVSITTMLIPEGLTEADLPRIEEEMVRLSKESLPVERQVMTKEDAKKLFQSLNEPFKVELIEEIERRLCYRLQTRRVCGSLPGSAR